MFADRDLCQRHYAGFALLTLASLAITLPFIFYARDMADSIRMIAEKR